MVKYLKKGRDTEKDNENKTKRKYNYIYQKPENNINT